jgi:hypothetical protein
LIKNISTPLLTSAAKGEVEGKNVLHIGIHSAVRAGCALLLSLEVVADI